MCLSLMLNLESWCLPGSEGFLVIRTQPNRYIRYKRFGISHLYLNLTPKEINCLALLLLTVSLFEKQDWVKTEFQIGVLTLVLNLRENRIRHARGPVHSLSPLHIFGILLMAKFPQIFTVLGVGLRELNGPSLAGGFCAAAFKIFHTFYFIFLEIKYPLRKLSLQNRIPISQFLHHSQQKQWIKNYSTHKLRYNVLIFQLCVKASFWGLFRT